MKNILLAVVCFCAGSVVQAQQITKLYGFWHYQPAGNIPRIPVEEGGNGNNGPAMKAAERKMVYYVYFECSSAKAPAITRVTVNDVVYRATVQKIETLPAIYEYYDGQQPRQITMVPAGRKHVFVLALTEKQATVKTTAGQLQVEYKLGKAIKKMRLSRLKELPASVVQ